MAEKKKRVVGVISGKKLKKALKSKKGLALAAAAAVAALLFFSASGSGAKTAKAPPAETFDAEAYVAALEQRLESIISSINGAGKTRVMLTLDGSAEYYYQSDVKQSDENDGDAKYTHGSDVSTVIVKNSDGSESPVLASSLSPPVTGAVVVCRGAGSTEVRESVYNAVRALLGLPPNKICVLKMS